MKQQLVIAGVLTAWSASTTHYSAAAEATNARPVRDWTLHAELGLNQPPSSSSLPSGGVLGLSLARHLGGRFAVEALAGVGLPVTARAQRPGQPARDVDIDSGLHGAALLRWRLPLGTADRVRLSFGAGPAFVSGDVFGTVPLARLDGAVGWRFAKGAILSVSIGYETALETSRPAFDASECVAGSACPPQYKSGDGQVVARWGLGFTF